MMRTLWAETVKLATLPATWVATALMVAVPPMLALLNARMLTHALETGTTGGLLSTETVDEGFGQLTLGIVGVAVLGVTAISSEYARNARTVGSGRQISTTSTACPRRLRLFIAKLAALSTWVVVASAVAIPLTVAASRSALGSWATPWQDHMRMRGLNAGLFWLAMAWMAFGITALLRNGIVPLAILITNASMVSFSLLAAKATEWAKYLPDLAAYPSFLDAQPMVRPLPASSGQLVLAAWAIGIAGLAGVVFSRRDA